MRTAQPPSLVEGPTLENLGRTNQGSGYHREKQIYHDWKAGEHRGKNQVLASDRPDSNLPLSRSIWGRLTTSVLIIYDFKCFPVYKFVSLQETGGFNPAHHFSSSARCSVGAHKCGTSLSLHFFIYNMKPMMVLLSKSWDEVHMRQCR